MSTKSNLSVAEKTAKLNEMVAWFNSDEFVLEQALDKFTEAEKLAQEIETDLTTLKNKIEVVKVRFDQA
jgi:exodeoxyribonuclease VII small subunit